MRKGVLYFSGLIIFTALFTVTVFLFITRPNFFSIGKSASENTNATGENTENYLDFVILKDEQYFKLHKDKQSDNFYLVLYSDNENVFYEDYFPKEPWIVEAYPNVFEIGVRTGNPGPYYIYYYDIKNQMVSDVYSCSELLISNKYVYFVEISESEMKLIIRDIFDMEAFYQEFVRDFKKSPFNPTNAVTGIEVNKNTLTIEYYDENSNEIIEVIEIE